MTVNFNATEREKEILTLRGEVERLRAALTNIEAAALRNNGPLARDRIEDEHRGIGLCAQNALRTAR